MSAARIEPALVHARLRGGGWRLVLLQLGVAEEFLRGKRHPGPCPMCGGRDRYIYDDRTGRGDFFCRHCGAGDGFELVRKLFGLSFPQALERVASIAGIASCSTTPMPRRRLACSSPAVTPTRRVLEVLRGACRPEDVADVRDYLSTRRLWPLPAGCTLRAHASLDYWEQHTRLGHYPALIAEVCDLGGERVTTHVTYLERGSKLAQHEPRKILSPMNGRTGCAARLVPLTGDTLGIAEGVETALSAAVLQGVPTWAALNTALLAKFEPPSEVHRLIVLADRDAPGLEAAARLMERLQGRMHVELRVPPAPHKDWNDCLQERSP